MYVFRLEGKYVKISYLFQVTDKGEVDGEEDAFRNFSEIARNNQASTVKAQSRNPDEQ